MAHTHSSLCYAVETFIVHKNKVLLRYHDKYHFWLSVGGHIESGEDPNEAALREVKEEVGLDVELCGDCAPGPLGERSRMLISPFYLDRHRVSDTHEHIALVFFARSNTDAFVIPATEKAECKWFTKEDLDDPRFGLKQGIKFYATKALEHMHKI